MSLFGRVVAPISILLLGAFVLPLSQQKGVCYAKSANERPVPIKAPEPDFPESLRKRGVEGIVSINCEIDEEGNVSDATVTKATHPDFEKPAPDAIRKWKFKPAKKDGKPVKVRVTIPFHFNFDS